MTKLTWPQVRAWRLARQHLADGSAAGTLEEAALDSVGIHAQVASCAEQALQLRVPGATVEDVRAALWERKTVVRTWAMRGTLHLLPASEYAEFVAALGTRQHWRKELRMVGMTDVQIDALIEAIDAALTGRCLTREELADEVAAEAGHEMRELMLSGWGSLLKPNSYLGMLCSGPNRGHKVTFVRPADWLGGLERVEPDEGWRRVCRRYVRAYGPATHQDLAAWWGAARTRARHAFGTIASELTEVDVEGRSAWALTADVDAMSRVVPTKGSVRLLPGFDTYVMGAAPRTSVVPQPFKSRVSRTAGWISPVVLLDGVAVGVWKAERSRDGTTVFVEAFDPVTKTLRSRVEREARRMEPIIGSVTDVRFEESFQGGVAS